MVGGRVEKYILGQTADGACAKLSTMNLSQTTRLTLQWLQAVEVGSDETLDDAEELLIEHLEKSGNTQDQVRQWLDYSTMLMAYEDETIESVMETEVILARMQERIRTPPLYFITN